MRKRIHEMRSYLSKRIDREKVMLPALGHIGSEVRSFYSVDDKTCLLAGAEQEAQRTTRPWSTQVVQRPHPVRNV